MIDYAKVILWGEDVGAVAWSTKNDLAIFEFEESFINRGLDISPVTMPLVEVQKGTRMYSFPELRNQTFLALPGLLVDSLPDKFGDKIINTWLARNNLKPSSFSPVERLCYIGKRGMGALEFSPYRNPSNLNRLVKVDIEELTLLTQQITKYQQQLNTTIAEAALGNNDALAHVMRVGTSAGGAKPKAVIALNDKGDIRSGQTHVPEGFDHWILKFDIINDERQGEPKGYGRIEYAYYLMAKEAGVYIAESQLLEAGNRAHFLTKRFDRVHNEKMHMLSLCGLAHLDFNLTGAYSYEQAIGVMRSLKGIGYPDVEQQYRRAIFNVIARNCDDHTKNISFLMDKNGKWSLSPAYDVTYVYNLNARANGHQMSLAGKRNNFTVADLQEFADFEDISKGAEIIEEVLEAIKRWPQFAKEAGVPNVQSDAIGKVHGIPRY